MARKKASRAGKKKGAVPHSATPQQVIQLLPTALMHLEAFLHKVACLDVFEVLSFKYKLRDSCTEESEEKVVTGGDDALQDGLGQLVGDLVGQLQMILAQVQSLDGGDKEGGDRRPGLDGGCDSPAGNEGIIQDDDHMYNESDSNLFSAVQNTLNGALPRKKGRNSRKKKVVEEEVADVPSTSPPPFLCCQACLGCFPSSSDSTFSSHSCKGNGGDASLPSPIPVSLCASRLLKLRRLVCGVCGEEYRSVSRMTYHLSHTCTAGPYPCELCHLQYPTRRELNSHKKSSHLSERSFLCSECGKGFKFRASLQKHQVNRHETTAATAGLPTCQPCGRTFVRKTQLHAHLSRVHGIDHESERRFLCQQCGQRFYTGGALKQHLAFHLPTAPVFPCPHCSKSFGRRDKLKYHIRTHTGERPHPCPVCGKGFVRRAKMQEHLRRHRGERRHVCPHCTTPTHRKAYASSWDLTVHLRKHHGHQSAASDGSEVQEEPPVLPPEPIPASLPPPPTYVQLLQLPTYQQQQQPAGFLLTPSATSPFNILSATVSGLLY